MATLSNQILDLVGGTLGTSHLANVDQNALNDYLMSSAKTVIDLIPTEILYKYQHSSASTSSSVYSVSNARILTVTLGGYGCRQIQFGLSAQSADSNSIHFATAKSPVYFINASNEVSVKPTTSEAVVDFMAYPTIDADVDSAIANFPDTAEYAVVLGAATKVLQNVLSNHIHVDEDSELASTMQLEIGNLQGLYQHEISKFAGGAL